MKNKLIRISLISLVLLSLVMPNGFLTQIENQVLADDSEMVQESSPQVLPDGHSTPWRVEGTGTYFEINDSEYLNITLKSTQEIKIILESIPKMISLDIGSSTNSTSTNLTLDGLKSNKTYFKYQDSYKNGVEIFSDGNGSYGWNQDLTQPHHIWFQEIKGTTFIDENTVLDHDIVSSVEIIANDITLDCNGHKIQGSNAGIGILIIDKDNVTIKNCQVSNFSNGIVLMALITVGSNNLISQNKIKRNGIGIVMDFTSNDLIEQNIITENYYDGISISESYHITISNNEIFDNIYSGISLYSTVNNTISQNIIKHQLIGSGIYLENSNNNKIYHNNFINNNALNVPPYNPQAYIVGGANNLFDNGYPEGGNYWSDYTGKDEKSGEDQYRPGSDGIGDTHHIFPGGKDNYPFMRENGWEVPKKWSFAVITDLHIGFGDSDKDYGAPGWDDDASGQEGIISTKNLREAVNTVNSNKDKYNIDFVVVTGDFTDSAEISELNKAKEILNSLEVPWVPIIGNHDVWPYYGANPDWTDPWAEMAFGEDEIGPNQEGADIFFNEIFNAQYEKLKSSGIFQNFEKTDIPIWNPEINPNRYNYFQNFAFDYGNYHFISLDFNTRDDAPWTPLGKYKGVSAEGDLHNFSGGTWNWFTNHLQNYLSEHPTSTENIVLLAHHPFFALPGFGFSQGEINLLYEYFRNYKDNIFEEFAGHTHFWTRDRLWYTSENEEIMHLVETGANIKNPLVRVVQVYPDGTIDLSKMLPEKQMYIKAFSPVDLVVTDPDGLIINKELNEIPDATYIETDIDEDGSLDDLITIPERKLGDYQIKVIPEPGATPTDTYTLEVSTLEDSFGYIPIVLAENVPISEIPTQPYFFASKEKEATQLAYTGDLSGQYSDPITLSATLIDEIGNPLPGKTITFEIGSQSTSVITNGDGIATTSLVLNQIPGKYYFVDAAFAGDEDYLPSSDSKPFEILKENVAINVPDKEGFAFDTTTIEAEIKDDDGDFLHQENGSGYFVEFKIATTTIGTSTIDEYGKAKVDWNINLIPKEIIETYPIIVIFLGNEYYSPVQSQGTFTLESAKWLKQDAVSELEQAKTGNKRTDRKIDQIIKHIQNSLDDNLWLDSSHLVFFKKDCSDPEIFKFDYDKIDFEEMFDIESDKMELKMKGLFKGKCFGLKFGIKVFHEEYIATKLMLTELKGKPKIPEELKNTFEEVITKLVKADQLLAKASLYDAKNTLVQNPKFQKIVEKQIKKSEEELLKAEKELEKGRPDKAISRLAKSWLHSQLAIKFAMFKD